MFVNSAVEVKDSGILPNTAIKYVYMENYFPPEVPWQQGYAPVKPHSTGEITFGDYPFELCMFSTEKADADASACYEVTKGAVYECPVAICPGRGVISFPSP